MERDALLHELKNALPVIHREAVLDEGPVGLILVDLVRGFTRHGALADPVSMAPMLAHTVELYRELDPMLGDDLHLLLLRDSHAPDIPEPPYPPHCIQGTGEDDLDPDIEFLTALRRTTVMPKDCINGFVGTLTRASNGLWRHGLCDWAAERGLTSLILVGDCTDICVADLCVTLLSARNHGMLTRVLPEDREAYVAAITGLTIFLFAPACATFHVDPEGPLPAGQEALRHPGPIAHHVGLWLAQSRGAVIADRLSARPRRAPDGERTMA